MRFLPRLTLRRGLQTRRTPTSFSNEAFALSRSKAACPGNQDLKGEEGKEKGTQKRIRHSKQKVEKCAEGSPSIALSMCPSRSLSSKRTSILHYKELHLQPSATATNTVLAIIQQLRKEGNDYCSHSAQVLEPQALLGMITGKLRSNCVGCSSA